MRNNFLINPRQKGIMFSVILASALTTGLPAYTYANKTIPLSMQTTKVNGTVVDDKGQPIIGASVRVKGSTSGVITDLNGKFSLNVNSPSTSILVSFMGYNEVELKAADASAKPIILQEASEQLNEVVVVGYGTQKKATLTGAVAVVGAEQLENKGSLASPLQALQGQVPGVMITRSSGAPGEEGWTMKLRGASSVNNQDPLVIIDGVEYSDGINGLRNLNPDDIESMNFLKDASAAIYGSKAAGGVVLITTKRAKAGKTKVEYSGSFTGKVVGLQPKLMNIDQWSDAIIEAQTNDGTPESSQARYARLAKLYKNQYIDLDHSNSPFESGDFTGTADFVFMDNDWQKLLWGNSYSTSHDLSVSGGSEKVTYRLSLGYMYDGSPLQWGNNDKSRYNMRLNNMFKLAKNLKLESVIAYNREQQITPSQIGSVLSQQVPQPGLPSSSINGKPYAWGNWKAPNWLAELGGDNKLKVSAINISESFTWNITKDLDAFVQLGYNTSVATRDKQVKAIEWYNYAGNRVVWNEPNQSQTSYTKSYLNNDYYLVSGYLTWHHTYADIHNISIMAGAQYNYTQEERSEVSIANIKSALQIPNGSGEKTVSAYKWHEAMLSYYGRLNYDYKQRYLVEGLVRYDGSSKFQPENRWQCFWGVSGGWRISEESFMKSLAPVVSNLKLRLSYGVVGNQGGIDRYDGVQLYNFSSNGGVLMNGTRIAIINTNGKIVSTERTWERIHNYNVALDFGFFDNRLTGTAELFWKKNNNMLIAAQYPGVLGDSAPSQNMGKFKANGYELTVNWMDKIGDVRYHFGGTMTYTTNKLVDLGATSMLSAGLKGTQQGYPLNSYFGYRYMGRIQTKEQLEKYKAYYLEGNTIGMEKDKIKVGDNMFEDVNKDGKLTEKDLVYLGTNDPKMTYSFNAGVEWKGIDVSVIFQGVARRTIFRQGLWRVPMQAWYLNSTTQSVGNTWTPENRDAYYPRLSNVSQVNNYNYQISSWSVEDGAYIRLKNVTVGYNFPSSLLAKTKVINALRIYFTGADLWEHSKIHDGWDPEQTANVSSGLERYPFSRTFTIGLNATF